MALALALTGAVALGFGRQQGYHLGHHQGFVEGRRTATAGPAAFTFAAGARTLNHDPPIPHRMDRAKAEHRPRWQSAPSA